MKKIFILFVLATVALASCTDDNNSAGGNKFPPAQVGDKILFGGTMSFDDSDRNKAKTRTVYGDKNTDEGYTKIKWLEGDIIRIFSPAAVDDQGNTITNTSFDYEVADGCVKDGENPIDTNEDEVHAASFEVCSGSGFYWGEGTHNFYGIYPSPEMLKKHSQDDAEYANYLKVTADGIEGYLPSVQLPKRYLPKDENNMYTIHPAMRYAYMAAKAENVSADAGGVNLTFYPLVTAVEMTLVNSSETIINGISAITLASADDKGLCGKFSTSGFYNNGFDITLNNSEGETNNIITIPILNDNNSSVTLRKGEKIKFTAFLLPETDIENLEVSVIYDNGASTKTATLHSTTGIKIVQAQKKNFIHNVQMDFYSTIPDVEYDSWMYHVPDETLLAALSIPAAGGAASGHTSDWDNNEKYLQQNLTIEELWDEGIRCFEFTVDYKNENDVELSFLGDAYVYCNSKKSDITLSTAVNTVLGRLKNNPTEFAMVIVTYQQIGGWDIRNHGNENYVENGVPAALTITRDPSIFMNKLDEFWATLSFGNTSSALYNPGMTMKDARGKFFCIARPTSEGEDDAPTVSVSSSNDISSVTYPDITLVSSSRKDILVINGWSAMKDKFERRGYTKCAFLRGEGNPNYPTSDNQRGKIGHDGKPGKPYDVSSWDDNKDIKEVDFKTLNGNEEHNVEAELQYVENVKDKLTTDFSYTTSSGIKAWVQDWARVSNLTAPIGVEYDYSKDPLFDESTLGKSNSPIKREAFMWANSQNEKLRNVQECLNYATGVTTVGNGVEHNLYINSLCGFFIDPTIRDSYLPNSLTEMSCVRKTFLGWESGVKISGLTGGSHTAGMVGNISSHAMWINNVVYNYLLNNSSTIKENGKSVGIIMMDRVSNDPQTNTAGYYIPKMVLSFNSLIGQEDEAQGAALSISVSDEDIDVTGEGVELAAPAKR